MRVLKGMLKEELDNSVRMQKSYERELAQLPRGSLVKKTIRGHEYYYLVMRDKGKVKFVYKGKSPEGEVKKYMEAKKYRAKYRRLLSETKKQIKFLRSALRGKQPV
jgi:hypothetical protein